MPLKKLCKSLIWATTFVAVITSADPYFFFKIFAFFKLKDLISVGIPFISAIFAKFSAGSTPKIFVP
ncbi:MAG: hypothetical protein ACD_37C00554G0001 [uncultured bacterium]|nr:MAG: hypothetical protein ACD_37C00554G0001 [uncultured bacterium]